MSVFIFHWPILRHTAAVPWELFFSDSSLVNHNWFNNLYHHIRNDSANYPSKEGWTKVSGVYKAQGGEKYMNIGRFDTYENSDCIYVGSGPFSLFSEGSYVYIDSVYVGLCNDIIPVFIVPNIITPNGDGINDLLEIESKDIFSVKFSLYSRWGNLVAQLDNTNAINLDNLTDGVYFWIAEYKDYYDVAYTQKGTLTITR